MRLWPFTRKTTPIEQKSLAAPDAGLLKIFGLTEATSAGIVVSAADALRVPAVANAIQLISEAVASLDVTVKRIEGKDEIDVPDHPLLPLLRDEANDWTSGFELIRQIVRDALMRDTGGLAWVNRIRGEVREIICYRQGVLQFDIDDESGERRYRHGTSVIPSRDVIHLLPPHDRAPLTLAREAIGIAVALDRHAAGLFANGARPSGLLKIPAQSKEQVTAARDAWNATHGGQQSGRTAVLINGADWTQLTMNSTDGQFLENRKFQIQEIARAFNIPAPMIGDLERATWSNSEQKGREFLSYCLEPWLRGLEGALRRALFSDDERQNHVIRFDRDDLTRADLTTRATAINSLISSRTISPNEGRSWLGLPPRDGGDTFENPNITQTPKSGSGDIQPPAGDEPEDDDATE